jgi:hypothetical protein
MGGQIERHKLVGTGVKHGNKWMYEKCLTSTYLRDLGEKRKERWKCHAAVLNKIFFFVFILSKILIPFILSRKTEIRC